MFRIHRSVSGCAELLVFQPLLAFPIQKRGLALGPLQLASCALCALRGAPGTGQQHAKPQHGDRADRDPEKEQRAGRPGHVKAERAKIPGQGVSGPRIGQHPGEPDDHRDEQNDQSNDDDHVDASDPGATRPVHALLAHCQHR